MKNSDQGISAIIVTYQRPDGLEKCLAALSLQTYQPSEVIVIDNAPSEDEETQQICNSFLCFFPVKYFKSQTNSLPVARNLGVSHCSSEFVALIDDDVRLSENYFEEILKVFSDQPNFVGGQGYIDPGSRPWLRETLQKLFGFYHHKPNTCTVLSSISTTYPLYLTETIPCEWVSGSNQFYRRKILNEIKWDEKLLKYADGEDLDHSYRIYQKYPDKLFITPNTTVYHDEEIIGRSVGYELMAMREVYGWYLLNKLFPHSLKDRAFYLWSRFGKVILTLGVAVTGRRSGAWTELGYLFKSYQLVWNNRKDISNGELEVYNSTIN